MAPSEEQGGPGFCSVPGSTIGEGADRAPPRGEVVARGLLDWLGRGKHLPYPGVLVRMAPSQLPWDVVLGSLDGAYGRAVMKDDAGWVGCLHEYLQGRLPLEEYISRFPLLGAGKGAEEEDEALMYFDPDTPWWEPGMVESQRFHHGLAQLSLFGGRASTLPSTMGSIRTQGTQFPGSGIEDLAAIPGTVCQEPAVGPVPDIQMKVGPREEDIMDATGNSFPGAGVSSTNPGHLRGARVHRVGNSFPGRVSPLGRKGLHVQTRAP